MVTSNPVQPVVRTLQVLEALNRKPASGLADLRHATGLPKPTLVRLRDAKAIEAHRAAVRRRGYAVPISPRPLRMIGIAIPLRQRRHVFGALVMRFPGSVMSAEQAAERYLGALTATARAIVKALDAQE